MRRRDGIAGSVAVAAVLIVLSGCGGASRGAVAAPEGTASVPAGGVPASASAAPSTTPGANPTVTDTHQVCGAIFQTVSEGASAVGTDLGAMVGHLSGANDSAASASRNSALHKLSDLATHVRSTGAPALDPVVRTAAGQTADRLQALATDPNLLAGVKDANQLGPVIQKITAATDPLTTACA